jgi:hypothetical protein
MIGIKKVKIQNKNLIKTINFLTLTNYKRFPIKSDKDASVSIGQKCVTIQ